MPSDWNVFGRICIDVETKDEHLSELGCGARRGAHIVGVALCFDSEVTAYLPIRHENGTNLDVIQVMSYVRDNCRTYRGWVVGANLGYDLDMLAQEGVEFPACQGFKDVLIAEPLLNELEMTYSLEAVASRRLGIGKDENLLEDALRAYAPRKTAKTKLKRYLYLLPPPLVGPYAEQDVRLPLQLLRAQEEEIERQELQNVWRMESQLLPALVRMRRRGIRVHQDRLDQIDRFATNEEAKVWAEVKRQTGVRVNVGQSMEAKVIAPILDHIGVRYSMGGAKKTQPSIDKFLLESIDHPVGALIRRGRQMSQLRTTFVASVRTYLINGRIHGTLNQLKKSKDDGSEETEGAQYGRLSGSDPNMQQQPARDPEIGPMWRSIYLPEEWGGWASKDFSQQEPKWLIHCSALMPVGHPKGWGGKYGLSASTLQAALDAAARYRENPNLDCYDDFTRVIPFGVDLNDIDQFKAARKKTKEIYLGRCYGMGDPKMCYKMGVPTEMGTDWKGRVIEIAGPEGRKLIDAFDGGVPYAKEMATLLGSIAQGRGYIKTHSGRRCRFPEAPEGGRWKYDWTHKALNRVIQGSSADEVKEAVIQLDAAGYYIQLQVHDEIDGTYESREQANEAAEIMRNAIPKVLPMKVDVEFGSSWGEAK